MPSAGYYISHSIVMSGREELGTRRTCLSSVRMASSQRHSTLFCYVHVLTIVVADVLGFYFGVGPSKVKIFFSGVLCSFLRALLSSLSFSSPEH